MVNRREGGWSIERDGLFKTKCAIRLYTEYYAVYKHFSTFCNMEYVPQLYKIIIYALTKYDLTLTAKHAIKIINLAHRKINPMDKNDKAGVYISPHLKIKIKIKSLHMQE